MKKQSIELRDVQVSYDDMIIIPKLDLTIQPGKITIVIGPNGCGKSTMLKTIGRILSPRKGEVLLDGASIHRQSPKEVARRMAVLPQSPIVPEGLLVHELVAYGRYPYQSPMGGLRQEDIDIIEWAMSSTGIKDLAQRVVSELSGGQRQRVWIAMALAQRTDILVLDEPTTYLDMANQLEILQLLRKLNQEMGITVLIVMHELNNAIKFADHIIGMRAGRVLFSGAPAQAITRENLKLLYDIDAELIWDKEYGYPVCINYELVQKAVGE